MITRLLLLCVALASFPAIAHAQDTWATYSNARFGTSIEYPSRFRPGRPPDNGDGQNFTAPDGATLSVWGSLNALDHNVAGLEASLRENAGAGERITYRAAGSNWLVLSGTREDRIFYERHMFSHRNEIINAFKITYPAGARAQYDPIVGRLSRTLRAGSNVMVPGRP